MHGRITPEPPAIVAEAELDERQLIQAIASAAIRDNFAVGRYALQWHDPHSHTRSDAALADIINKTNTLDEDVSRQYIATCRRVVQKVARRRATLSWTHHATAVDMDAKNAQAWLEKAEANQWSVAALREAITRKVSPGKIRSPGAQRQLDRDFRQFKGHIEELARGTATTGWLRAHRDMFWRERDFFRRKLESVKRNADRILASITKPDTTGKEV